MDSNRHHRQGECARAPWRQENHRSISSDGADLISCLAIAQNELQIKPSNFNALDFVSRGGIPMLPRGPRRRSAQSTRLSSAPHLKPPRRAKRGKTDIADDVSAPAPPFSRVPEHDCSEQSVDARDVGQGSSNNDARRAHPNTSLKRSTAAEDVASWRPDTVLDNGLFVIPRLGGPD